MATSAKTAPHSAHHRAPRVFAGPGPQDAARKAFVPGFKVRVLTKDNACVCGAIYTENAKYCQKCGLKKPEKDPQRQMQGEPEAETFPDSPSDVDDAGQYQFLCPNDDPSEPPPFDYYFWRNAGANCQQGGAPSAWIGAVPAACVMTPGGILLCPQASPGEASPVLSSGVQPQQWQQQQQWADSRHADGRQAPTQAPGIFRYFFGSVPVAVGPDGGASPASASGAVPQQWQQWTSDAWEACGVPQQIAAQEQLQSQQPPQQEPSSAQQQPSRWWQQLQPRWLRRGAPNWNDYQNNYNKGHSGNNRWKSSASKSGGNWQSEEGRWASPSQGYEEVGSGEENNGVEITKSAGKLPEGARVFVHSDNGALHRLDRVADADGSGNWPMPTEPPDADATSDKDRKHSEDRKKVAPVDRVKSASIETEDASQGVETDGDCDGGVDASRFQQCAPANAAKAVADTTEPPENTEAAEATILQQPEAEIDSREPKRLQEKQRRRLLRESLPPEPSSSPPPPPCEAAGANEIDVDAETPAHASGLGFPDSARDSLSYRLTRLQKRCREVERLEERIRRGEILNDDQQAKAERLGSSVDLRKEIAALMVEFGQDASVVDAAPFEQAQSEPSRLAAATPDIPKSFQKAATELLPERANRPARQQRRPDGPIVQGSGRSQLPRHAATPQSVGNPGTTKGKVSAATLKACKRGSSTTEGRKAASKKVVWSLSSKHLLVMALPVAVVAIVAGAASIRDVLSRRRRLGVESAHAWSTSAQRGGDISSERRVAEIAMAVDVEIARAFAFSSQIRDSALAKRRREIRELERKRRRKIRRKIIAEGIAKEQELRDLWQQFQVWQQEQQQLGVRMDEDKQLDAFFSMHLQEDAHWHEIAQKSLDAANAESNVRAQLREDIIGSELEEDKAFGDDTGAEAGQQQ